MICYLFIEVVEVKGVVIGLLYVDSLKSMFIFMYCYFCGCLVVFVVKDLISFFLYKF